MKRVLLFAVPFALALLLSGSVRADDFAITIGCQKCAFEKDSGATECGPAGKTADGKVLILKGDAMKDIKFKDGGEYIVTGKLSADGKAIEVTEIKKKA